MKNIILFPNWVNVERIEDDRSKILISKQKHNYVSMQAYAGINNKLFRSLHILYFVTYIKFNLSKQRAA